MPSNFGVRGGQLSSRRAFLQMTLAGGITLGVPAAWARGAGPVQRNGKAYMKLSLAAYSFRKYLDLKNPKMTLEEFIRLCADLNLDGTELTSYYFPKDFGTDYLLHVKQLAFRLGLDISGTAINNNFCIPPGPQRDSTLAHTRDWIDYSAVLGAPVIRIFAGYVGKVNTEQTAVDLCVAGINQSLEYAATKGVCLALENHGGITETPEQILKIVGGVKESPWFGINFDGGNFHSADPYADLEKIAPYAINAQVKTSLSHNGKHEEADLGRVVRILADAGYRGYVALEYESSEDPKTAVPRHIETLRKHIRDVS